MISGLWDLKKWCNAIVAKTAITLNAQKAILKGNGIVKFVFKVQMSKKDSYQRRKIKIKLFALNAI